MLHQEFESSRQRAMDMRSEVGRNRLEARLHNARHQEAKPSRSRPPGWEAQSVASTLPSRWKEESAIYSSTPRVWC